jgi:hypothetical protein
LITLPFKTLIEYLEQNRASDLTKTAEVNYRNEQKNTEQLKTYNLPTKEQSVYLRVFPRKLDPVVRANLQPSVILCSVLRSRYPKMETPPILFTDRPAVELESRIGESYRAGCRFFCLDFYSHGTPDSLTYKDTLAADQITVLLKQFPQARFQISTIGCYGGGLRDGFMREFAKHPDLEKRVSVFLQSKPDTPNKGGFLRKERDNADYPDARSYSTYYYLFLTQALLAGKSYGEAAHFADVNSKRYIYTDPEAIIDGRLYSRVGWQVIDRMHV